MKHKNYHTVGTVPKLVK